MATLDICLPIKWAPGQIRKGRWNVYWPKTTQAYKAALAGHLLPHKSAAFLKGPLAVTVHFIRPRPTSAPKREWFTVRPDMDNLLKPTLDEMTGVLFGDDSQIVELHAYKRYGDEWKLQILVETLGLKARLLRVAGSLLRWFARSD